MNDKNRPDPREKKPTLSPFRSLENYKAMQAKTAADKGRGEALKNATTLTAARRIVYGPGK